MPDFRYKAFISYSWSDAQWGKWLHHAIETYRTPKPLIGQEGRNGIVPPRLLPLFKDRDEEAAGASIGKAVEEALASSEFLIVICSPRSAQSQWVNREIAWFKTHRSAAHILALIVDGEPGASAMPGRAEEECFPKALTHRVNAAQEITNEAEDAPLAADAREIGDGKRGARLKIAAALLGVGLDDLVRRDDRRRARIRLIATSASLAIAAAMSVLAWSATVARDEAVFQRNEAQGLTEFMLTDLRGRLDEVGRLDILETVGQRLMSSYDKQNLSTLDSDALGRRARVQLLLGEIENSRGNLSGALKTYQAAATTTGELLARDPDEPRRMFDHAQSLYWIGYIAWQRGDLKTAKRQFQGYDALADQMVATDPNNFDWQLEKSYAQSNLGTVASDRGDLEAASQHFAAALAIDRRHYEANRSKDDAIIQYGSTLSWAARVATRRYEFATAESLYGQGVSLYRQATQADPKNQALLTELALLTMQLARAMNDLGHTRAAMAEAKTALALATALSAQDPANAQLSDYLGNAHILQAQLAAIAREFDRSEEHANWVVRSVGQRQRAGGETTGATQEQLNLARLILAQTAQRFNRTSIATQTYARILEDFSQRDLSAAGSSDFTIFLEAQAGLAMITGKSSPWEAILGARKRAKGTPLASSAVIEARALMASGRKAEGRAILFQLRDAGYAHPNFVALLRTTEPAEASGKPAPRSRSP